MKYSHIGVPTTEKREDEKLVEGHGFRYYKTPYAANKWHIMWHRFPEDHGLPEILTRLPHIAFEVEDLEKEIEGKEVLFGPYEPIKGYRVAMIVDGDFPVELIETQLTEEEISALEA